MKILPSEIGSQGEKKARVYLQRAGLHLLTKNHRCKYGEIDLIMQDGDTLVFVEVRQRTSQSHGSASESIDAFKLQRLMRCAKHYLAVHHENSPPPCRFDVVAIDKEEINWIKDINIDIQEYI